MFFFQLDCSPSLQTEPQLRLEAAKSTTGKLIVVVHPHTIISIGNEAIYQLLLARFWPNFKGRFLGTSLADFNCHDDIWPGNICPGNICLYQQYFSCYWSEFDQTLKVMFLGQSLTDANCHGDICPGNICPRNICPVQEYLTCYWPIFDSTFWTKFWQALISLDQKCFWTRHFLDQTLKKMDPKFCRSKTFFWQKRFWTKFFCIFVHRIFGSKFFLDTTFFMIKIFFAIFSDLFFLI